jgi:hypothetical protein
MRAPTSVEHEDGPARALVVVAGVDPVPLPERPVLRAREVVERLLEPALLELGVLARSRARAGIGALDDERPRARVRGGAQLPEVHALRERARVRGVVGAREHDAQLREREEDGGPAHARCWRGGDGGGRRRADWTARARDCARSTTRTARAVRVAEPASPSPGLPLLDTLRL